MNKAAKRRKIHKKRKQNIVISVNFKQEKFEIGLFTSSSTIKVLSIPTCGEIMTNIPMTKRPCFQLVSLAHFIIWYSDLA